VQARRLERGEASEYEMTAVAEALAGCAGVPLWIQERVRTVAELGAWGARMRRERGLACVVVDYLQLLAPARRSSSRQEEIGEISRSLKQIATDHDLAVLALSQLSRAPETRRDKRPHLSDLRDSGALEQDADLVLLLFRPELYGRKPENEGIAEVIVAKNRNGPVGVLKLYFNAELAEFRDLAL
jgi:replicative DNA helicase